MVDCDKTVGLDTSSDLIRNTWSAATPSVTVSSLGSPPGAGLASGIWEDDERHKPKVRDY